MTTADESKGTAKYTATCKPPLLSVYPARLRAPPLLLILETPRPNSRKKKIWGLGVYAFLYCHVAAYSNLRMGNSLLS